MTGRILIDTNVLVYIYDRSDPEKQRHALDVLDGLIVGGMGVVSTQVLAEFFTVVTRKLAVPLTVEEAYTSLEHYLQSLQVLDVTPLIVLEAARGVRDHKFSFWDAQIWATARLNQIVTVFSEDFNAGASVEGVQFVNPFASEFQLADWAA